LLVTPQAEVSKGTDPGRIYFSQYLAASTSIIRKFDEKKA